MVEIVDFRILDSKLVKYLIKHMESLFVENVHKLLIQTDFY